MKRLGKFATDEQINSLKQAASGPYLVMKGTPPVDLAVLAHRYALEAGLPEIEDYYGCDLRTGEFLSV